MVEIDATFFGMCCFIGRPAKNRTEVYLPTGRGDHGGHGGHGGHTMHAAGAMDHVATLAIASSCLDFTKEGFWAPSGVIQNGTEQTAYWRIDDGDEITFADGHGEPTWVKDATIQFNHAHTAPEHAAKSLHTLNTVQDYPVIFISGGSISNEQVSPRNVKMPKLGKISQCIARGLRWKHSVSDFTITSRLKKTTIYFRHNRTPITLSVTNVGTVPGAGREHFPMYYTLLCNAETITDRIIYDPDNEHSSTSRSHHHHVDDEVRVMVQDAYDCVPPTGGS